MTLRDRNLRFAAMKLIQDIVKDVMNGEKADHLEALEASAEDSGAKSWTVSIGGEKVASLTLSQRSGSAKITDEAALVDAIEQVRPDMVETRLRPWAAKELLAGLADVTEDGGVTEDGEILPGITWTDAGSPYQSLRWSPEGREQMAEAIRSGELSEILADTGLPGIEPR